MQPLIAYVDGLNLNFCLKHARFKRYYWLDVARWPTLAQGGPVTRDNSLLYQPNSQQRSTSALKGGKIIIARAGLSVPRLTAAITPVKTVLFDFGPLLPEEELATSE